MISISVGQSTMAVNPSVAFWGAKVRPAGLVSNMVARSCLVKLTCYVEEHCSIGGNIVPLFFRALICWCRLLISFARVANLSTDTAKLAENSASGPPFATG